MKKLIILIALFILSVSVYGQEIETQQLKFKENYNNFIIVKYVGNDTIYICVDTLILKWGEYIIKMEKGEIIVEKPELPKYKIKYRCPNGCESAIFQIWMHYEGGETYSFYYDKFGERIHKKEILPDLLELKCSICDGIFKESELLATAKMYMDSLESVKFYYKNAKGDTVEMFNNYLQYTGMDDNLTLISKRFDSLEKRILGLEKMLEGIPANPNAPMPKIFRKW